MRGAQALLRLNSTTRDITVKRDTTVFGFYTMYLLIYEFHIM